MKSLIRPLLVVALPFAVAACGSILPGSGASTSVTTDIPSAIAAPSGATLAVTLKASGLQNYECRAKAGAPGGYDWVFVAPEAVLKDQSDAIVGRHFGGPTWEYGDGSKVSGKTLATAAAPQAGNIPWELLKGTAAGTPGVLSGVTFVQRIHTIGGTAPSDNCSAATAATRKGVRYSADYLFYKS
jgi:hypothetical protein